MTPVQKALRRMHRRWWLEKQIPRVLRGLVVLILLYFAFSVGRWVGNTPACYEDSALFWGGTSHNVCVPVDDFPCYLYEKGC